MRSHYKYSQMRECALHSVSAVQILDQVCHICHTLNMHYVPNLRYLCG